MNAGIPYAAALVGCKLVLPGAAVDGKSLYELMEAERVTLAAGVPTVWLGLLNHVKVRFWPPVFQIGGEEESCDCFVFVGRTVD